MGARGGVSSPPAVRGPPGWRPPLTCSSRASSSRLAAPRNSWPGNGDEEKDMPGEVQYLFMRGNGGGREV